MIFAQSETTSTSSMAAVGSEPFTQTEILCRHLPHRSVSDCLFCPFSAQFNINSLTMWDVNVSEPPPEDVSRETSERSRAAPKTRSEKSPKTTRIQKSKNVPTESTNTKTKRLHLLSELRLRTAAEWEVNKQTKTKTINTVSRWWHQQVSH